MTFSDGEKTGEFCKCGQPLFYEMSFSDAFNHKTGHYTVDRPLIVCNGCDYVEDYEEDNEWTDIYDEKQVGENNGKDR